MRTNGIRLLIVSMVAVLAAACSPPPEPTLPTFADLVGCYRANVPGVDDLELIDTGYSLGKYNRHPVTGPELCAGSTGPSNGAYYYVVAATEADALAKCGAQFVNPGVADFEPNFGPDLRYAWACFPTGP